MSVLTIPKATEFYRHNESRLVFVVVIILSLYLLTFAAKITWSLIPQPENQGSLQAGLVRQSTNTNNTSTASNITQIINQNLFGDAAEPKIITKAEEVSDVPETQLNLVLSGVVSSSDPNRGAAIIEYRNNQSTYGVGDKIDGTNVTLDEIYVDRVIIKNRVTRETLMLDGIDFNEANKKRVNAAAIQNQEQPQTNSPRNTLTRNQNVRNQAQALRQARQKLTQEPASFTDMISLSPHRADGVFIGFRVTPGANPALFNSVGLKSGDVVIQLNGLDLSDLQQSQEAMKQLQESDSLQLEVLRGDEYLSLNLDIPDDSGNE